MQFKQSSNQRVNGLSSQSLFVQQTCHVAAEKVKAKRLFSSKKKKFYTYLWLTSVLFALSTGVIYPLYVAPVFLVLAIVMLTKAVRYLRLEVDLTRRLLDLTMAAAFLRSREQQLALSLKDIEKAKILYTEAVNG